ncbi:MAG: hypothetical protein JO102_03555 [Elusimicrobia bacterium]|nr:hypothetical protein [Elusimicrobiota bacterium]
MFSFLKRWFGRGDDPKIHMPSGPVSPAPTLTGIDEIDFHIRLAEKAYDLMYDSINPTTATAAYSDMKESFSMAIQLAEKRGLTKHVQELQKRRDHCQDVYRNQFR